MQDIVHLHGAIRAALHGFSNDVSALQSSGQGVNAAQLAALVERHRFLRAVCAFHAASEDEVLFPAARWVLRTSHRPSLGLPGHGTDSQQVAGLAYGLPAPSGVSKLVSAVTVHRMLTLLLPAALYPSCLFCALQAGGGSL